MYVFVLLDFKRQEKSLILINEVIAMSLENGIFTISLDFELYWGLRDKTSIDQYKNNLQGVRKAVHQMLRIFGDNNIHATWATVGFLFFEDINELKKNLPKTLPQYKKKNCHLINILIKPLSWIRYTILRQN